MKYILENSFILMSYFFEYDKLYCVYTGECVYVLFLRDTKCLGMKCHGVSI